MSLLKICSGALDARGSRILPILTGNVFTLFGKTDSLVTQHPLDTERDQYDEIVKNWVIPACKEIVPDHPTYRDRLKQLLEYTNPAFPVCWNYSVELMYKFVAPKTEQTEENLKLMRILRAVMEIEFSMTSIIDDIVDESDQRKNKPTWHTFCEGGKIAAVYDAMVCSQVPAFLVQHFFKDQVGYGQMLEALSKATLYTLIGQNMDYLSRNSLEDSTFVRSYKAGKLFQFAPTLGLLHAKVTDRHLINEVEKIFYQFGLIAQIMDDFSDVYGPTELTGKNGLDSINAATTWSSTAAIPRFDSNQLALFNECYGSSDTEKLERIKQLYNEINLPMLYLKEMNDQAHYIYGLIDRIPNEKIRNACSSYTGWCLGSAEEIRDLQAFIQRTYLHQH